jgi:hypothetical protein
VDTIDALKIDVEGFEDIILGPFFRDAPQTMWPRMIVIEDQRASWAFDLMAMLETKNYRVATRSKQNLILRRLPEQR